MKRRLLKFGLSIARLHGLVNKGHGTAVHDRAVIRSVVQRMRDV